MAVFTYDFEDFSIRISGGELDVYFYNFKDPEPDFREWFQAEYAAIEFMHLYVEWWVNEDEGVYQRLLLSEAKLKELVLRE